MEYLSRSPAETEALGESFGRTLSPGAVLAFRGELGMGKTAFTRGLARGLGCTARVTSPTFTIVNEYPGRIPLFHFDLYRLPGAEALFDIGWDDYLDRGGVCAVEWSERAGAALPPDTVLVALERCAPPEGSGLDPDCCRRITIAPLFAAAPAAGSADRSTEGGGQP